jgi:hypothetical protein
MTRASMKPQYRKQTLAPVPKPTPAVVASRSVIYVTTRTSYHKDAIESGFDTLLIVVVELVKV